MGGLFALGAKVTGGGDERFAEVPAPNAIDDDAGGQRGAVAEEFLGEVRATGARA